jgi:hypothetical protein
MDTPEPECGSVGCLIGLAQYVTGEKPDYMDIPRWAMRRFHLTAFELEKLFYCTPDGVPLPTPVELADRIEAFVASKRAA